MGMAGTYVASTEPPVILPARPRKERTEESLLPETDKYYVVVSNNQNEKSIELSKDSVAGIVVLGGSPAPQRRLILPPPQRE